MISGTYQIASVLNGLRRVGLEPQHLGASGGAVQREALAERARAGGSVEMRVEQSEAGASEKQRLALPCLSARPRPGRDGPGNGNGWRVEASVDLCACLARGTGRAETASPGSAARSERSRVGATHAGMAARRRRFVTCLRDGSAPLAVLIGCPIS